MAVHSITRGMIGRQSDTQTGVENHALRCKIELLEAIVRDYVKSHGDECRCQTCDNARRVLSVTVIDRLLKSIRR